MMKHMTALTCILRLLAFSFMATAVTVAVHKPVAQAHIEFNTFYISDGLARTDSITSSRMFIEGTIGFEIDKKGDYLVGWNYSMFTTANANGTDTVTYASTQMGPRFLFMLDRSKRWSFGLGYYLVTTATFAEGSGTSETWKGTALKADLGYSFPVGESVSMGLRMNYSSASYTEKLTNGTTYEVVGYTSTFMYPSIYAIVFF